MCTCQEFLLYVPPPTCPRSGWRCPYTQESALPQVGSTLNGVLLRLRAKGTAAHGAWTRACSSSQCWAQAAPATAMGPSVRTWVPPPPRCFHSPEPLIPGPGNPGGAHQTKRPGVGRREGVKSCQQIIAAEWKGPRFPAGALLDFFLSTKKTECGRSDYKRAASDASPGPSGSCRAEQE